MARTQLKLSPWTRHLTTVVAILGAIALMLSMLDWYSSLPIVYVSSTTKKCVRVEQIPLQKRWSCDDIVNNPDINYTQIWVK